MLYSVNEIFHSIQGEGFFSGVPTTFIRFAGCNLKCSFCDTDHSENFQMTSEQILERISIICENIPSDNRIICITGGEPTNHELEELLYLLKRDNYFVSLETNGTRPAITKMWKKNELVNWVTFSPKENFCYDKSRYKDNQFDEIKIVLTDTNDPKEWDSCFTNSDYMDKKFIQPCSENYQPAVDFVLNNYGWRLSIQTQKIIGVK